MVLALIVGCASVALCSVSDELVSCHRGLLYCCLVVFAQVSFGGCAWRCV